MIKHLVIWDLDPSLDEKEKVEHAEKIKKALEELKGQIEGVISIQVKTHLLPTSNGDILLDSTFENEKALKNYQTHPRHLKAAALVKEVSVGRKCVDYFVDQ